MKVKLSLSLICSFSIFLTSVLISYIGINEVIIGYITFINLNYGLFYGGESVLVNITSGQLSGFYSTEKWVSREGKSFYEFLGIPFAKPPIGELRFKPPEKIEPWNGIRDATGYGNKCWQFDPFIHVLSGDEDCLYLNVFTPTIPQREKNASKLPVIVFIHGGLFMFGRAEMFRPEYFMDADVVLVQIHYRLGAFGFLNVNEDIRGNMGLKDQVMALEWVQENIEYFGGDKTRVTLLGESAGGSSIHLHMLSPMSRGLFHGAITMSGTALNNWAFNPKPQEQAKLVGQRLGCQMNNTNELANCLKDLPAYKIADISRELNDFLHHRLLVFAPTVESFVDQHTFLSHTPRDLISQGKILTKVPWINGVNSDEGLIYAVGILLNSTCTNLLNTNWNRWAPRLLDYEEFEIQRKDHISQTLLNYYMKSNHNFSLEFESIQSTVKMFSDGCFYRGLQEATSLQAKYQPIYLYYYSYKSQNAIAQTYLNMFGNLPVALDGILTNAMRFIKSNIFGMKEIHYGASHADELTMLFQFPRVLGTVPKGSKDFQLSKMLVNLWTSFARFGKPVPVSGINWPPVSVELQRPLQYLELNENVKLVAEPFTERLNFWNNLLEDERIHKPRR